MTVTELPTSLEGTATRLAKTTVSGSMRGSGSACAVPMIVMAVTSPPISAERQRRRRHRSTIPQSMLRIPVLLVSLLAYDEEAGWRAARALRGQARCVQDEYG